MATYKIVASTTDPPSPGEIAAGGTILVSDGDVFIIDSSADAKIAFQADGGIPANFAVVINDSNVNTFEISVLSDLTPTVMVADNVDASGIKLGAAASDAVNFTAGDNVQFGEYIGSIAGADTISIGKGFTTTATRSTSGGDDSIIVGDDATFLDISGGSGNDTITLGDGATTGKIKGGAGDDAITVGKAATISSVDGEGGNDTLTTETGNLTVSNVETVDYVRPAYFSEVKYSTEENDFIEIATEAGTDLSGYSVYIYNSSGSIQSGALSLGSIQNTVAGQDVYLIDPGKEVLDGRDAIALVDNTGAVIQFISFNGNTITATTGPASGQTSTEVGSASGSSTLQSTDHGATYQTAAQSPGTVPCYAPGTLIDTPLGPRPVEALRLGDLVLTVDHGAQPIRWIRSGDHRLDGAGDDQKPVLVKAGALGSGLPRQDLIVSPQHRILVGGGGQLKAYFKAEAFVPAKSLTGLPGIRHMKGKRAITWVHFACARHEVVLANGCQSESLLLGSLVTNGLRFLESQHVIDIFGPTKSQDEPLNGPPARDCLTPGDVRRQLKGQKKAAFHRRAKTIRKWDEDAAMEAYEAEMQHEAELVREARKRRMM